MLIPVFKHGQDQSVLALDFDCPFSFLLDAFAIEEVTKNTFLQSRIQSIYGELCRASSMTLNKATISTDEKTYNFLEKSSLTKRLT
ncbi:MAG: hypothetical protein HC932_04495 [Thermales bacterium]|nr:hypothetical protein [Thermales bacterium]